MDRIIRKRSVAMLLAAALLLAGMLAAFPRGAAAEQRLGGAYVNVSGSIVRADANGSSTALAQLAEGVALDLLGFEGDWARVTVRKAKLTGYLPVKNVTLYSDEFSGYGFAVVTGKMHLRAKADASSKSLAICYEDDVLKILKVHNAYWYKVENEAGDTGYVTKKYCRILTKTGRPSVTPTPSPTPAPTPATVAVSGNGTINTSGVHFRTGPSRSYPSDGKLSKNTKVQLLGLTGDWYRVKVTSTGKIGYVSAQYVTREAAAPAEVTISGDAYINASGVRLRTGPSTSHSSQAKLSRNTKVRLLGQTGEWYKVKVPSSGKTGYVSAQYVTREGVAPDTPYAASGTVNASGVHIRLGPGTSQTSLGKLSKGTRVAIQATNGSWYKVKVDSGLVGYVSKKYVTIGSASSGSSSAGSGTLYVQGYVNASDVSLRKEATSSSSRLARLAKGTPLYLISLSDDWYRVRLINGGQEGYVYKAYVTRGSAVVTPVPTAPQATTAPNGGTKTLTPLVTPAP